MSWPNPGSRSASTKSTVCLRVEPVRSRACTVMPLEDPPLPSRSSTVTGGTAETATAGVTATQSNAAAPPTRSVGDHRYVLFHSARSCGNPHRCKGDRVLSDWEASSAARVLPPARPRKLAKVPFVELADGRLQGVVSSGSDLSRVYVSSVAAGDFAFACSTNNNRPCGGARGSFCNHIRAMVGEAVLQYGAERVARYLRVDAADQGGPSGVRDTASLMAALTRGYPPPAGSKAAASVFSRFLRHLSYLELAPSTAPLPEMQWFAPTRAAV
jgi:hypothetical protein